MKNSHFLRNWILLIFFLIVVLGVGGVIFWNYEISAVDLNGQQKALVVNQGESVTDIAQKLKDAGVIRSPLFFKIYLKLSGRGLTIAPGDFKVSPAMTLAELVNKLSQGPDDLWVRFQEGWRVEQMADELNAKLGIMNAEFLKLAKEGYMFPDSYLFNQGASVTDIAARMKQTFDQKYDDSLQKKVQSRGLTSAQGVILASIVEREARSDQARTMVAGILLKRFKIGMALNADATVQYARDLQLIKSGKLTKFWQPVTVDDYKEIVSPYNTYLNAGLPPAPICNPSLSSLKAVANADSTTPYLFYYHDSQGNSYYAKTLEEHNENVAKHP